MGLHSSTFRLAVSKFCGTGGPFRGCLKGDLGMLGGIRGRLGVVVCVRNGSGCNQKWTSVRPWTQAYNSYVKDGVDPITRREGTSSQFKVGWCRLDR